MMRIGIDYTAAVRQGGGIGRYTRELVHALLSLEASHTYVLLVAVGGLRPQAWHKVSGIRARSRAAAVRVRSIPLSDEWLARLWQRIRLPVPVEVFTGPLDVFYCPDFVLPPTRRATRTVLTVHDLSFLHYPSHFVPKLVRYLSKVVPRSVGRADRILADSEATRADIVGLLGAPEDRVEVLYSGVDDRFHPQPLPNERRRLLSRYRVGERPYLLSVSTLQPRKNLVRLVQAFRMLDTTADLVIAGGRGWMYDDIYAEAAKCGERVHILGFVDDDDLPALYRNAALFAFPSLYEGFGLPVLEAMACGAPTVCSNASSLPEVAGDAALLVDPLDTESLASAMARLLEDPVLCREMISKGLGQAAHFRWAQAAQQLLGVLTGGE